MLKKEDPDNRLLALLRNRDQEMAQRKELDSPEIPVISVLPTRGKKKELPKPELSTEEILSTLEQNYQPIQDCFTMVDNLFFDEIAKNLTASSQVIYLHLYRLSHGWNKPYCRVGRKTLTDRTNISKSTIKRSIKELKSKNYIKEISWAQDGSIFQILLPREILSGVKMTIVKMNPPGKKEDSLGGVKMTIPKMTIVKMTTPNESSNNEDNSGGVKMTIPKMTIPKMTTPDESNNNEDNSGGVKMTIPKMTIPNMTTPNNSGVAKMTIPKMTIPNMTTPNNSGVVKMTIPKMTPPQETPENKDSSGGVKMTIVKMTPNKYNNINKESSSKKKGGQEQKKTYPPPPSEERIIRKNTKDVESEKIAYIEKIVENFYKILNRKESTNKKKKDYEEIKKLIAQGYKLPEIEFAANWVAMGKSGAAAQSFSLVPYCIGRALEEQDKLITDKKKKDEKSKIKEKFQEWKKERDEGEYLDEYYESLKEEEKKALEKEALEDLSVTNPHSNHKELGFMKNILLQMKLREIVRKKYFPDHL